MTARAVTEPSLLRRQATLSHHAPSPSQREP
eukprot:CAMPEP_0177695906 /NCGR_PEP_ID=MMETSP0484_2-20121128/3705_1 /TAXON_ID=354590 /ORGANISM="Rhodomonas lens, Strain RHODO" /LENGTH=30 /DNA_ID= /DNA_START= /DNA_END= /DNA_ORIENTATION=